MTAAPEIARTPRAVQTFVISGVPGESTSRGGSVFPASCLGRTLGRKGEGILVTRPTWSLESASVSLLPAITIAIRHKTFSSVLDSEVTADWRGLALNISRMIECTRNLGQKEASGRRSRKILGIQVSLTLRDPLTGRVNSTLEH